MMNLRTISQIGLLAISIVFFACGDDEATDSVAPTLTLTNPTEEQLSEGFTKGDDIVITGALADEQGVNFVGLYITSPAAQQDTLLERSDLEESTYALNFSINTENAAVGEHKLLLVAKDGQGATLNKDWTIIIKEAPDSEGPGFILSTPTSTELAAGFAKENDVTMTGTVTDPSGILSLALTMTPPAGDQQVREVKNNISGTSYNLTETLYGSENATPGNYIYNLTVVDKKYNSKNYSWTIKLN
jgi:hypothetical protein